jgi:hypothetical protein
MTIKQESEADSIVDLAWNLGEDLLLALNS